MTQTTTQPAIKTVNMVGFFSAILVALITLAGFFVVKPPISGPFCPKNCIGYPYADIVAQFPKDYVWMYFMIVLMIVYVVWTVALHHSAPEEKKIFSQIGLVFAMISASILIVNYFVQLAVIQPSILNGENEGIALLTQYNPHGVFIALEELGYLIMSVSFLFMGLAVRARGSLEGVVRWIFWLGFLLSVISFFLVSYQYGIHREYIFECYVIVITWFVLILNGIISSILFRRTTK